MLLTREQCVWEDWIIGYYPYEGEEGYDGIHDGGEILSEDTPEWIRRARAFFKKKQWEALFNLLEEHGITL